MKLLSSSTAKTARGTRAGWGADAAIVRESGFQTPVVWNGKTEARDLPADVHARVVFEDARNTDIRFGALSVSPNQEIGAGSATFWRRLNLPHQMRGPVRQSRGNARLARQATMREGQPSASPVWTWRFQNLASR